MRHCLSVGFVALLLSEVGLAASAQEQKGSRGYPPNLPGARPETYKTVGDVKLNLYVFTPEGHQASDKRPAIVFFFGGGWTGGSPGQFEQHCKYLAGRGMVAITADYRVASRHNVKAITCVADAKSAIRYVRANAARLGIDPAASLRGGGSAGEGKRGEDEGMSPIFQDNCTYPLFSLFSSKSDRQVAAMAATFVAEFEVVFSIVILHAHRSALVPLGANRFRVAAVRSSRATAPATGAAVSDRW